MNRGFGWIPDDADERDHLFSASADATPPKADLGHLMPAVLDQGSDSSCVVQGVATVVYAARIPHETSAVELLSRKALWWLGRHEKQEDAENTGMQIRSAFRLLNRIGFCRERHFRHSQHLSKRPPVDAARMMIDQRNLGKGRVVYERLSDDFGGKLSAIRSAIAAGLPVVFGVDVSHDFARDAFDPFQPVDVPVYEEIAGGHAMVCYGFDGPLFRVRNSWGAAWGNRGDCLFTSDYMMTASDLWTVPSAPPFSDTP